MPPSTLLSFSYTTDARGRALAIEAQVSLHRGEPGSFSVPHTLIIDWYRTEPMVELDEMDEVEDEIRRRAEAELAS